MICLIQVIKALDEVQNFYLPDGQHQALVENKLAHHENNDPCQCVKISIRTCNNLNNIYLDT